MILADRGFARTSFFRWLNAHGLDYVVRLNKRTCLTEGDGRRWKLGEDFKDAKSLFGLARVQIRCPKRLSRLLMALTVALSWLTLMGLPEVGAMPRGWQSAVAQRGRASITTLALALLDELQDLPPSCLPRPSSASG